MPQSPSQRDTERPWEPPRKRQRVASACERCRNRKIKCDGVKPSCGGCQQLRQRQPSQDIIDCKYQADGLKFVHEKEYIDFLHLRIRELEKGHGYQQTANGSPAGPKQINPSASGTASLSPSKYAKNGDATSSGVPARIFQDQIQSPGSSDMRRPENTPSWPNTNISYNHITSSPSVTNGTVVALEETISAMGAAAATDATSPESGAGFYGASSAISFFNQIQDALNASVHSGPSQYLPQTRGRCSIQGGPKFGGTPNMNSGVKLQDLYLPPRPFADLLLNSYWEQVHSLYPIVHKSSFLAAYSQLWVSEENATKDRPILQIGLGSSTCPVSVFYCGLNAMFALGCNLSDMPYDQRRSLSGSFCQRSLDLALGNLLDNNSLALVQALFILGQFLQSTDYPTRCWNVVGLALRVAQGIGLYMDNPSSDRPLLEVQIQRRTWHGCLLLDIITSMTLGRPALVSREASVPLPDAVDDTYLEGEIDTAVQPAGIFSENTFFVQTLKLYAIFGEVLTHVYKPWEDKIENEKLDNRRIHSIITTVIGLEHDLLDFKSNLPPQLNWDCKDSRAGESWLLERQRNILYTRFLHLKVLLYRPIFHQFYSQSQRGFHLSTSLSDEKSPDKTITSLVVQRYASVCIESAQQLIAFVNYSSQTKAAGAWWYSIFYMFSCAMILILAGIEWAAEDAVTKESIEESWNRCLRTLDWLATKDIRARACAKTLVKLREQAIAAQNVMYNTIDNGKNTSATEASTNGKGQEAPIPNSSSGWNSPKTRAFFDDAVEFYDPLLQDVLWQQPEDSQLPWDLTDADWWQGMLKRP